MMATNSRTSKISGTLLQALGFLANLIGAAHLMLEGTSIEPANGDGPSAGASLRTPPLAAAGRRRMRTANGDIALMPQSDICRVLRSWPQRREGVARGCADELPPLTALETNPNMFE
jgi:hypothetical protein